MQQINALLTQQVTGANAGRGQDAAGLEGFTYRARADRPVAGSVKLNGTPIDKATTYRIVTNNFLSDGGDGFPAFTGGTNKYFGGLDIDAFADYLTRNSPYTPGPLARITSSAHRRSCTKARSASDGRSDQAWDQLPACRALLEHTFVLASCPQTGSDTGFSTARQVVREVVGAGS